MDSIIVRFDSDRESSENPLAIGGQGDNNVLTVRFVLPEVTANQLAYVKLDLATPVKTPLTHNGEYWDWLVTNNVTLNEGKFAAQVESFDAADTLDPVWNSEQFNVEIFESLSVNSEIEPVMLPELLEAEAALQAAIAKTEDILDAIDQEEARETAEAARVTAEQGRVTAEQGRVSAEKERVSAEQARVQAESGRAQAESGRAAAEIARVAAEQEREQTFEQFEQDIASGKYNGADGLSVELRLSGAYLQWRPTGGAWQNLVALSAITGPAGEDGTDGQSPTITIGVVAKGDTAAATLTGTYPDYVLNLTLPKGDTGSTGATGPTGPKGDDGVSPTISVSKSGKITTITIVDAAGTHTATINDGADGSGAGDMVRATYDANENGIVDDAEKLGGQLPEHYASVDDLAEKASLPVSDTPPEDSEFWVDTGVSPTMLRRWRGADVPTGREYQQTISADTGSASLSIDNAQGQLRSVALEMGCVAKQAGSGDPSLENIRAISGRESVDVRACGKNLLPRQTPQTKFGVALTVQEDGGVHLSGTCTAAEGDPIMFSVLMGVTLSTHFPWGMRRQSEATCKCDCWNLMTRRFRRCQRISARAPRTPQTRLRWIISTYTAGRSA